MVGLVIVSHSAKLAEGVVELARGVAGPDVEIAATGGLDLPDRPLGTDANLIAAAIQNVYSEDGVIVLMDLGSAILAAEMAVEALSPEQRQKVVLVPAPLVEGAIAAAVQARLGSSLAQVVQEAHGALSAKQNQLLASHSPATPRVGDDSSPATPRELMIAAASPVLRLVVSNRLGLHARPAALIVQTTARFNAKVSLRDLTTGRGPVNAKSINGVTTLGVLHGHTIEISASGAEAQSALDALSELAVAGFGEVETTEDGRLGEATQRTGDAASREEGQSARLTESMRLGESMRVERKDEGTPTTRLPPTEPSQSPESKSEWVGLAAAPGGAVGNAVIYMPPPLEVLESRIDDPAHEWKRLLVACEATRQELDASRRALLERGERAAAGIFEAQALMLDDEALLEPARRAIIERGQNAPAAFNHAAEAVAAQYEALPDEYLRARGHDLRAVARQVMLKFSGSRVAPLHADLSGILVARDLTPAETAALDPAKVLAICTAFGAPTGHSAILARSLGIPAVVAIGERLLQVADGTPLIVDGDAGRVWVNPGEELIAEYTRRIQAARAGTEAAARLSAGPAATRDGRRIEVAANIGSPAEVERAVAAGADAVGLFRTEFLYFNRRTPPTEEEQYAVYRTAAQALGGRRLLIRTLDAGGDKPLPYMPGAAEANPFLGHRGLRLTLAFPELFMTQLRALVRVAAEFPVRVMFPMVATLPEWRAAREYLERAISELNQAQMPVPARVEAGMMVEIPAAALNADAFARHVDFFSIGTNDLTQYTLAAERGNPRVAALADAFDPAVVRLIDNVVRAAHAQGKWVGVCGEMAGEPLAIPLLVGLSVDELSMNPPAIAHAKPIIRNLNYAETQARARRALEADSAQAVRETAARFMKMKDRPV